MKVQQRYAYRRAVVAMVAIHGGHGGGSGSDGEGTILYKFTLYHGCYVRVLLLSSHEWIMSRY